MAIIVLGNGFDLMLGYNTKYSDFIGSSCFQELVNANNNLAKYLKTIQGEKNWIDIEHELSQYAKNIIPISKINVIKLKREFVNLKKSLIQYLELQFQSHTSQFNSLSARSNFKLNSSTDVVGVYSLNYTPSAFGLCNRRDDLYFVHGNTYDKNIIFGVEDGAFKNDLEQFNFLLKSDHPDYGKINLSKAIQDADEIHFYGLSFGDTDNNHFEPAFSNLMGKRLFFYVYGVDGYEAVRNRLIKLRKNGLADLRSKNEVKFFDVIDGSPRDIDSRWLDSKYLN
jgi:Bacteriophage abortive infection AbiH